MKPAVPMAVALAAAVHFACPAAAGPMEDALADLLAKDERVAAVAYRLATANAPLCPRVAPLSGLVLHAASQYGPDTRAAAVGYFGLGDTASVLAVAPDSPADRAGIKPGDRILAIDGQPAPSGAGGERADYGLVEATSGRLQAALAEGPSTITIEREGARADVTIQPVTGCAYDVQVRPQEALNAAADGRRVFLPSAIVAFTATDDELAVVIDHELAHNLRRHQQRRDLGSRAKEREADYVGLYLAARAGYDIDQAPRFWRRFGRSAWHARLPLISHPSAAARAKALERTVVEIQAKQAAGEPLVPAP